MRFDRLAESQPENRQRQKGDKQVENEFLRSSITESATYYHQQALAILPNDGQNSAELDDNFKQLAPIIIKAEQIASQNQMPSR